MTSRLLNLPAAKLQQQHFEAAAPIATHRVEATCKEVECAQYVKGWQTIVSVGSAQEQYIDHACGRRFAKRIDGDLAVFTFYPGQKCFRLHTKSLSRPPILIHRKDWNGFRRVLGPNEWQDTFATTLEGFKRERG